MKKEVRSTKVIAKRMRDQYGELVTQNCMGCCNCQLRKRGEYTKICCAYSREIAWDPYEKACQLWNQPFLALRPPRRMLVEMFEGAPEEEPVDQSSLF